MKLKPCSGEGCNYVGILFKAKPPLCANCARKTYATPIGTYSMTSNKALQLTKKPKPINKLSDKEKKRQVAYMALKKEYMKQYPECQVRLEGCMVKAIDIHHLFFGADRYGHFLDSTSWKSTCRSCHNRIHDEFSSEQLIEMGLRKKE